MNDVRKRKPLFNHVRFEHLVAGVCGGSVSTVVLHPLDLIKIRFQVNEGVTSKIAAAASRPQYTGIVDAFRTICRNDGLPGLYQGVVPNVAGAGMSWGLYFLFYNTLKTWTTQFTGAETKGLSAMQHMSVAAEAGLITLVITNPVWVVKTRLCLQYDSLSAKVAEGAQQRLSPSIYYKGMWDCLLKVYGAEGIKGLYRGFTPGILGVSHGALQFMAYEEMKKFYNKRRNVAHDTKFTSAEYLCFAAMSKIFAAVVTYPYQVLRARLQDQHRSYTGMIDVIQQVWRYEGFRGYWKGFSPYLLHVTPNVCIVFLIYEKVTTTDWTFGQTTGEGTKSNSKLTAESTEINNSLNDKTRWADSSETERVDTGKSSS